MPPAGRTRDARVQPSNGVSINLRKRRSITGAGSRPNASISSGSLQISRHTRPADAIHGDRDHRPYRPRYLGHPQGGRGGAGLCEALVRRRRDLDRRRPGRLCRPLTLRLSLSRAAGRTPQPAALPGERRGPARPSESLGKGFSGRSLRAAGRPAPASLPSKGDAAHVRRQCVRPSP